MRKPLPMRRSKRTKSSSVAGLEARLARVERQVKYLLERCVPLTEEKLAELIWAFDIRYERRKLES